MAVVYASDDGPTDPTHLGAIGTRQCDIDALARMLQSSVSSKHPMAPRAITAARASPIAKLTTPIRRSMTR